MANGSNRLPYGATCEPTSVLKRSGGGFGEFFRYHGWRSPGVRLFRSVGFPVKDGPLGLSSLVPILLMLTFFRLP